MFRYSFLLVFVLTAFSHAAGLKAGVYAIDVTPERYPVIVNCGFNEAVGKSTQSRLHARCTVLDDGTTRIAIVIVDSCMMPREFLDATKKQVREMTGIAEDHQLIAATHTHSAPAVMGCLGSDPDPVYPQFLQSQIVRAVGKAVELLQPAKFGSIVVQAPKHTNSRRWILRSDKVRKDPFGNPTVRANMHPGYQNPDFVGPSGPTDPALTLFDLRTADDKPLSLWGNFSMHYFGTPSVSADYCGAICENLAQRIAPNDPRFLATMSQGTSGDLQWMDYGQPKPWTAFAPYVDSLAALAQDGYEKMRFSGDVTLAMSETKVNFGRRLPDAARLQWARDIQAKQKTEKPQSQAEIYAREALMIDAAPTRELKFQAIRIGDFGITTIPNEVYAITGLKIKAQSPLATTCVVELANGAEGYIPPPEQHLLGGYTTWPARSAGLEVGAEPRIVETVLTLLEKVAERKRQAIPTTTGESVQRIEKLKPLAYWQMDELSGTHVRDRIGQHEATLSPGYAFALDGTARGEPMHRAIQFVGGKMTCEKLTPTSISMWVWNGFPMDVRDQTGTICQSEELTLRIGGKAQPGRLVLSHGDAKQVGDTALSLRQWHHVALVREGEIWTVYLDGKFQARSKCGAKQASRWELGELEGRLDEVAFFDRALTAEEVASLAK